MVITAPITYEVLCIGMNSIDDDDDSMMINFGKNYACGSFGFVTKIASCYTHAVILGK